MIIKPYKHHLSIGVWHVYSLYSLDRMGWQLLISEDSQRPISVKVS